MASKEIYITPINLVSGQTVQTGSGSPESSATATPGSIYLDETGKLWLKETGSGNTGWAEAGSTDPAGSDTQIQFNDGGVFGASSALTFASGSGLLSSTQLRSGAADAYLTLSREATDATGNNFDKAVLAVGGTDTYVSLVNEVKGLGSFQIRSTSYPKNQPGFLGIDLQAYASTATETASGTFSCAVGSANTASGQNATAVGSASSASSTGSTAVGLSAVASGAGATAIGNASQATASNSLGLGYQSKARIAGMASFASGQASAAGDRQSGKLHLRGSTTSNETISLTVDGSALSASNSLTLSEGMTVAGIATFIGVSSAGRRYLRRRFMAYRASGGNATIDFNTSEAQNTSLILPDVAASVAANTTYQCADFQITGQSGVAADWIVWVEWVEMQN